MSCPCGAGPCALLTSTKPQSQGRKFYRCPKPKVRLYNIPHRALLAHLFAFDLSVRVQGEGQCGFFRFQDQPAEKAGKPFNYAQASDGGTGYEGTAEGDNLPGGGSQALQCHCGQDAVEITSHSAANPDRVFYKCPKTQVNSPDHSHFAALPNSSTNQNPNLRIVPSGFRTCIAAWCSTRSQEKLSYDMPL